VVLCADQHIDAQHLMFDDTADIQMSMSSDLPEAPVHAFAMPTEALRYPDTSNAEDNAVISSNLQEAVKSSEHQMILAAIQTTESRMEAAAKLGISPRTLRYKLAKLKAENGTMAWAA
jgi:two-component system response regulator FlrC